MDGENSIQLKRLILLLLLWPGLAWATSYSGDCAIWAQKGHPSSQTDYSAKFFQGNQTGYDAAKAYVGTSGVITINPGCDGAITLGTLSDSVQVLYHNGGGVTRTGAKMTLTIGRIGPISYSNSGGALRIVDGVTFAASGSGIQAALADLPSTGGEVYVPGGTYDVSSPIQLPANTILRGQGRGATILQPSAGFSGTALIMPADTTGGQQWCAVENLMIDGRTDVSRIVPRGILMKGVGQPGRIRDVTIQRVSGTGIWREGVSTNAANFVIENTGVAHAGDNCIYIGGSSGMTSLLDVDVEDPTYAGVKIDGPTSSVYPSSIFIHGLHIESLSSGEVGLWIDDAQGVMADGVSYYGSGNVGTLVSITGSTSTCKNIVLQNLVTLAGSVLNTIIDSVYGRTVSGAQQVPYYGTGRITLGSSTFASLGTHVNGTEIYCSDCLQASPCAGSGTGAFAQRINGAWDCSGGGSGGGGSGSGGDSLLNNTWIYWKDLAGNYEPTIKVDSVNALRFQTLPPGAGVSTVDFYTTAGALGLRFYGADAALNAVLGDYMMGGYPVLKRSGNDFRIMHKSGSGNVAFRDSANTADVWTIDNTGNVRLFGTETYFDAGNIASASSIALPIGNVFRITGVVSIATITAKTTGTIITLKFPSAITLLDNSGNLKLNGNFVGDAADGDDTVILQSDGTNWHELGRSLN